MILLLYKAKVKSPEKPGESCNHSELHAGRHRKDDFGARQGLDKLQP